MHNSSMWSLSFLPCMLHALPIPFCGLFCDDISISGYMALNVKKISK
jgi:hypothetical protein